MRRNSTERTDAEYTDEPMEFTVIKDFLPPPDKLVFKDSNTRVTINLKASNVAYFKREAKKHGTQYQKLIRNVLDHYVTSAERAGGSAGGGA